MGILNELLLGSNKEKEREDSSSGVELKRNKLKEEFIVSSMPLPLLHLVVSSPVKRSRRVPPIILLICLWSPTGSPLLLLLVLVILCRPLALRDSDDGLTCSLLIQGLLHFNAASHYLEDHKTWTLFPIHGGGRITIQFFFLFSSLRRSNPLDTRGLWGQSIWGITSYLAYCKVLFTLLLVNETLNIQFHFIILFSTSTWSPLPPLLHLRSAIICRWYSLSNLLPLFKWPFICCPHRQTDHGPLRGPGGVSLVRAFYLWRGEEFPLNRLRRGRLRNHIQLKGVQIGHSGSCWSRDHGQLLPLS